MLGVHDSGEAAGLLYYVMPFVEGETLRARVTREGALPLGDATRLLREIADALAYAHAQGVVHRDLKPENVLLSGGHAVIADFGIAKAVAAATQQGVADASALTATGMSVGTPAYMAPEQAVGDQDTDHRADLYALGVIAYEVLAGAHPFGVRTAQGLVAAHLTEAPAPLSARRRDVPPALAALVSQLLAKEPAARPQSADTVVKALDAASASPMSAPAPARYRRTVLAMATTLLVVASAVAYATLRKSATAGEAAIHTVAVLPFVNTGGNAADDYFSDGMTDELAHALARLPGLRIAGRTSTYAFKGKTLPAQEIGRALDVEALVEGTVRRAGDRLRVSAQLVSADDGKVLWDSVYESRSDDVFGVQDQFTRAVVAALAPTLGNRPADAPVVDVGRGTTDLEAYQLYLKGRYYWLARGADNVARSIDYFHQAIARDPNFARAHAGLALAYNVLTVYVPDPTDSVPALAAASARRAVALDSTLADAQIRRRHRAGARRTTPLSRGDGALSQGDRARAIEPLRASFVRVLPSRAGSHGRSGARADAGDATRSARQVGRNRVGPGARVRPSRPRGRRRVAARAGDRLHLRARLPDSRIRAAHQWTGGQRGGLDRAVQSTVSRHAGAGRTVAARLRRRRAMGRRGTAPRGVAPSGR